MCMGFSGPHHLSCCFMLHTPHLNCPFTVFPRSLIHLFSPSSQMSRPSLPLSLFAAGCVTFHCKTHTAPQMCAHKQTNTHTCRSRGYRELSEMPNTNSTQHRTSSMTSCCKQVTCGFPWNWKVTLYLTFGGSMVTIGATKLKELTEKHCIQNACSQWDRQSPSEFGGCQPSVSYLCEQTKAYSNSLRFVANNDAVAMVECHQWVISKATAH